MVGEFIQIFALLLAVGVMLLLFFMLAVRRDRLTTPLSTFLLLLAFLSLSMSYLSAKVYVPLPANATAVKYYQDPYGVGFLSVVMSLISLFLGMTALFIALANQGMRSLRP
jgi:4-amino-4-deoxy-L-arabinose transferase-like glycosyltransferase